MATVEKYTSKKDQSLDCGHTVKAGEDIFITKTFTCEEHAGQTPYGEARWVTRAKRKDNGKAGESPSPTESDDGEQAT